MLAVTGDVSDGASDGQALGALRDLRARRRRRHVQELDWIDSLYRVYLIAIFGALAIALVSGALGDANAGPHALSEIDRHGPALLGLLVALGIAGGVRSGARGGPLAIEAADVQHVLLAPVDRAAALRGPALRRLRTGIFAGAVVGAVAGNLAFRRLPGRPAAWIASGAIFCALIPLWALAAAIVASGRRLRPAWAAPLAILIVGWSIADLVLDSRTSPATMLGELALLPLPSDSGSAALPIAGMALALATAYIGLRSLAGTSLEAARRRAELATELRFAVTLHDLRTVILLRRELASERPRLRPWLRLRAPARSRAPVWRRDWESFLRWPPVRVGRAAALGAIAGVSLCGVWRGTSPLVVVAGCSLLVAGLDAIEPLAQEVDHPTRRDLLPRHPAWLTRRHLVAPTALMVLVSVVAVASALVVARSSVVLEVGAVMILPVALVALLSAALTATNDPYAFLLNPSFGYAYTGFPFLLAIAGVAPVLAAREAAKHGYSAAAAAGSSEIVLLWVSAVVIWALGRRVAKRAAVKP
jgi:hypothetical protein